MNWKQILSAGCSVLIALGMTAMMPRTAVAAGEKTIRVTDYGANGSDTLDDTEAFQKALNAAKNSAVPVSVVVPAGKYYIGAPSGKAVRSLRIYSNTTLHLQDKAVLIRQKSAASMYLLETDGQKNISLIGGTFNGNAQDTTRAKGLVSLRSTDNITLSGVTFKNFCGTHGVIIDGAQGFTAQNCTFSDFKPFTGSAAAYTAQTNSNSYWSAEALHIDFVAPSGSSGGRSMKNITVSGCTFIGVPSGVGTHHVYEGLTADSVKIYNNQFTGCFYDACNASNFKNFAFFDNRAVNTPTLLRAENTRGVVHDNVLDNSSYAPGAKVMSSIYQFGRNRLELHTLSGIEISNRKTDGVIQLTNSTSLDVYHNTIKVRNYTGSAESRICGIHGYYQAVVKAHENTVSGASYRGIYVDTGKAVLTNNFIEKCLDSLYVSNSTGSSITGNTAVDSGNRAINGYRDASLVIARNQIQNTASGRGITVEECAGGTAITENTVLQCASFGIYTIDSQVQTISGNLIGNGQTHAITLNSASRVSTIENNTLFCNAGHDLYITGCSRAAAFASNRSDQNAVRVNAGSTLSARDDCSLHVHSFVPVKKVSATCTRAGYTEYRCRNCSCTYHADFTAFAKHNYAVTTVSSTYLQGGYSLHTCTTCGHSYKSHEVPKRTLENVSGFRNVSVSAASIRFTWDKVPDADGYVVYLYNKTAGKWERCNKTTGGSNVQTISGLKAGESYSLTARAYKTVSGKEVLSPGYTTYKTSTNPAQVKFSVASKSKGSVTYSWTKVSGATTYAVYYKPTASSSWTRVGTVGSDKNTFTKTGLNSGAGYFTVRAYKTYEGKTYGSAYSSKTLTVT